ncbi:MAG: hypothetical protein OXT65_00595, partial [Alphaproteobacteria bacterium]|nr:hypothetical protein [Alphaproteobacteria bacterium]
LSDTVVYVLWTVAAVDLLLFFWLPKNMLEEPSGPEFRFFGAYFTVDALPVSYALVASVEEREGRAAERKRGLTAVDILLDPKELAARGMTKEAWAHVSELAFPHLSRARWPDSWLCIEGVLASDFPYARIGDIVKKYRQTEARDDGNAGF